MIAKGANFNERKWGNLRGNFIQQNLHGHNDDHKGTRFLTCAEVIGKLHEQMVKTSLLKDRESDGRSTQSVAFLFRFYWL